MFKVQNQKTVKLHDFKVSQKDIKTDGTQQTTANSNL